MSSGRKPGRPKGTQQDPAERRAALLAGAEAAIREHGPGVSMEQLADAAGVSKATLYDNFDGKGGLTDALVERYGERVVAGFAATLDRELTAEQVVRGGIAIFLRFIDEDPQIYRFVVRHAEGEPLVEEISAPIAAMVASVLRRQGAPEAEAVERSEVLANAILGTILSTTDWWSRRRTPSRKEFVALLGDFVWGGLVASGIEASDQPVDLASLIEAVGEPR